MLTRIDNIGLTPRFRNNEYAKRRVLSLMVKGQNCRGFALTLNSVIVQR